MTNFEVAHIRQQGIDLIIVYVGRSFGSMAHSAQSKTAGQLQECANSAGLTGTVVPVWDAGGGRMGFYAPNTWCPFFRSINLAFVARNINRKLSCSF
jgi:hypothetical protein